MLWVWQRGSPASRTPASLKSISTAPSLPCAAKISGVSHAGLVEVGYDVTQFVNQDMISGVSHAGLVEVHQDAPPCRRCREISGVSHAGLVEVIRSPMRWATTWEISGVSHAGLVEVRPGARASTTTSCDLRRLARRPR